MNQNLISKILISFIIFEVVVSNQLMDRFENRCSKLWFDKSGKKTRAPAEQTDLSYDLSSGKPSQRGPIGSVVGLLRNGMCIIKCVWKYYKDCGGLISCGWKCLAPEELPPDPPMVRKQNDNDIKTRPDTGGPKTEDLTPVDIVVFFGVFVKCLVKYKPFNKPRLQQFTVCVVIKGFCKRN